MNEHEVVAFAETKYGVKFKKVGNQEYRSLGGCIWCGSGGKGSKSDRFRLFLNGTSNPRVWCRQCDNYEFLDSLGEAKIDKIELRLAAMERQQEEQERRLKALEAMRRSTDHISYYNNMIDHPEAIEYWCSEGMDLDTIENYKLGFCDRCPTAPYSASYTIPVMYHERPYNIRHRLISPNGTGKYRPHMSGLPSMLFNADSLDTSKDTIIILEGEKKSIIVSQETGYPNVGVLGMQSFNESWVTKFDKFKRVYVAFDPDAYNKSIEVAGMFGGRGYAVSLPLKADDFFVRAGATVNNFNEYLSMARPV